MKLKNFFSLFLMLGTTFFGSSNVSAEDIYANKVKVSLNTMNGDLKKCSSWLSSKLPKMGMPFLKNYYDSSQAVIRDSKSCMLNEELIGLSPYDMHEVNNEDVDLQILLMSISDLQSIEDEIISLIDQILGDDFIPAYNSIIKIRAYFSGNDSFIKDIIAADIAIHECYNYTKNMVNRFPEVIPTPDDLKEKTGLKSYWHTSSFYNEIRIVYKQLTGYRASAVVKFEENAAKYKEKIQAIKGSLANWQTHLTKKTPGLNDYAQILTNYLDLIDRGIDLGLEEYNKRLDPNENVGKIFLGKIDLPYGHITTIKDQVGGTLYQKGYLNALGECQRSYENAWKDIRNKYRSDHNRDTPLGRKLSEYAPLK